ncbi:MAG: ABC transporter substrate-binding protein [Phycisphaeraceae bacterium]|jgi:ABC-type hemin transport system substrate-binding protein|nr:ABC transporter substrate-binding protein [Phycisphaeraceae bacterium]MDP7348318.1 ABC transporter substrate-binding protein [Phycisphaeraceae bacterium]
MQTGDARRRSIARVQRIQTRFFLALATAMLVIGCGDDGTYYLEDDQIIEMRVISFSPALTRIIVDMGQSDLLIAVGTGDTAAPEFIERIGTPNDPDAEKLLRAKPTHVLLMSDEVEPPVNLAVLGTQTNFQVITFKPPKSVQEIRQTLFFEFEYDPVTDVPITTTVTPNLAGVLDLPLEAQDARKEFDIRLSELAAAVPTDKVRKRVLVLTQTLPAMIAAGKRTVFHDVLENWNIAINVARREKDPDGLIATDAVKKMAPDVILLMMPGAEPLGSLMSDDRLDVFRDLPDVPAVRDNAIHLINDPMALEPSTSLPQVAAQMAKAIYPDLSESIDQAMIRSIEEIFEQLLENAEKERLRLEAQNAAIIDDADNTDIQGDAVDDQPLAAPVTPFATSQPTSAPASRPATSQPASQPAEHAASPPAVDQADELSIELEVEPNLHHESDTDEAEE